MVQINQNPCRVAGGTGRRVGFFNYSFFRVFCCCLFWGRTVATYHKKSVQMGIFFFFWDGPWPPYPNVHPKCNRPILLLLLLLLLYNAKKYILGTYFLLWSSISSTLFFSFQDLTLVNKIYF